ncbi:hypothetical protein KDD93_08380 [Campylobacter sp. faydin G-24]|uniref:Flagellar biosynthesis protein n=1 Tax=Campylobacter anatolicus TaxID=2829105 RepID=A0ABS5HJY3_9BACT|nr:hypothetical protein [Campylobacter anatolicus]MBR8462627.1 hypothetical protein [Campylobacter anatolicus]MBR8464573.1 hypothetical protein [Campylobacter anatolicus]MBR8465739.1 hypothetical protein [Campylobacter anatolicus]
MQFLPWVIILALIYIMYFIMVRYEKRIVTLSKLIEQNNEKIKENRELINHNRSLIEQNKKQSKDINLED